MDVNGSLRPHLNDASFYLGLDVEHGKNVDIVIDPRKQLPLKNGFADIVVSSSQLEHDQFFWMTFLEFARIVKPGGYIYINAPSNGLFHQYPLDCWRFYPDAGRALADWASHNGYECTLIESFIAHRKEDIWNDYVAVFQMCESSEAKPRAFISDAVGCENIIKHGFEKIDTHVEPSEDMRLFARARHAGAELEQLRALHQETQLEVASLRRRLASLETENKDSPN